MGTGQPRSFRRGWTAKARSTKLQKTSIRSAIDKDRNQRTFASMVSCCRSCRTTGVIEHILTHRSSLCNVGTHKTQEFGAAARSLEDGFEETLTINRLGLSPPPSPTCPPAPDPSQPAKSSPRAATGLQEVHANPDEPLFP